MWLIVSLVVGISLIIGACAPAAPAPEVPTEEALRLTVAGGSVGGSTQLWANACAGIAKKYLDIDATVITWPIAGMERAAHEGIAHVVSGKVNQIYEAVSLTGIYADYPEPMTDLRPLFYTMPASMQIAVLAESPYRTFRDLIGKRISPGFPAASPIMYLQDVLPAIGLSYEDDFDMVIVGSHQEACTAMIAGKLEAYLTTGAPPQPTYAETDLVHPLRLIGFSEEDMEAITTKCPVYGPDVIPAEYYHMDEPVLTFGAPTIATASASFPEEIAYALTKYYIENPEFVRFYQAGFADYIVNGLQKKLAEAVKMPVPYHPGAYRYYKECGWNIPAEMIPPEAK